MAARFLTPEAEAHFSRVLPQVMAKAKTYPGFISVDFWRNLADPALLLEDSYWVDHAAADAWRQDPFHQHLQKLGYTSLIMENTTAHFQQVGDARLFHHCPVCQHTTTDVKDLSKLSYVTQVADTCANCGFAFPVVPPAI
ncbi:antibiotic biosynthesis monooxygenase family protein [Paraburkholderia strydomiana]|uniref:antibiotic biosynthesis monooxygenase family protein n=1 Tax=Paraburkholderia strydomiana TaxID=1245417 RepID=UPI0038B99E8D